MGEPAENLVPEAARRRYELVEKLGAGAFGVVFRARDRELEREVAIKVLARRISGALRARFAREARALAGLNHPRVLRLFDFDVEADPPYLVTEFLRGIPAAPGRVADPVAVMRDVAEGLGALHAAGLLHRDVKPENVMVTAEGRGVLLDLGLVYDPSETTRLTRTGAVVGTLRYLAPELLAGESASAASDWFAWGATLYELLEGRPYRDAQDIAAMLSGRGLGDRSLRAVPPDSPAARAVAACLDPDPHRRPGVPGEVLEILGGRDVPAPPPAPDVVAPEPAPDRRPLVAGLAFAGVLALAWVARPAAPPPPPPALTSHAEAPPPPPPAPDLPEFFRADYPSRVRDELTDAAGRTLPFVDAEGVEVRRQLLDPDPIHWKATIEALPYTRRFYTWLEEGGAPERLPEAFAGDLRRTDRWFRDQDLPAPFFPFVHVGPDADPFVLPDRLKTFYREIVGGPPPPDRATGWFAAALRHLDAFMEVATRDRLAYAKGEGLPEEVRAWRFRFPVNSPEVGYSTRYYFPQAAGRRVYGPWLAEGRRLLHSFLYLGARAIEAEPEVADQAGVVMHQTILSRGTGYLASHLAVLPPAWVLGGRGRERPAHALVAEVLLALGRTAQDPSLGAAGMEADQRALAARAARGDLFRGWEGQRVGHARAREALHASTVRDPATLGRAFERVASWLRRGGGGNTYRELGRHVMVQVCRTRRPLGLSAKTLADLLETFRDPDSVPGDRPVQDRRIDPAILEEVLADLAR